MDTNQEPKTIKLIIPPHLIVDVKPPFDENSDFTGILDNGMWTDICQDSDNVYSTLTNDTKLIDYVEERKKEKHMKKYVKIQSSKFIQVTGGLSFLNMTDDKAPIADKLKVLPLWSKEKVKLMVGTHWYPAQITEWKAVQALNADGVITIGVFSDELPAEEDERQALAKMEEELTLAQGEIKRQAEALQASKRPSKTKLEDIAE